MEKDVKIDVGSSVRKTFWWSWPVMRIAWSLVELKKSVRI